MISNILDGQKLAEEIIEKLKIDVKNLANAGIVPGLAVIMIGEDPASLIYVNGKRKMCKEVGIISHQHTLPAECSQSDITKLVSELNNDPSIDGILIQLPLPAHINEVAVLNAISPQKDVDVFHPLNIGKMTIGESELVPCTAAGIMELIAASGIEISGKNCVVVGRSNIVGKPVANLLLQKNGTVTICHSHTKNLADITKRADILVVAMGKAEFIKKQMVQQGALVIDVGINRLDNGRLVGDVAKDEVKTVAAYITPVPGGVGPMTKVMLMKNTIIAARLRRTSS